MDKFLDHVLRVSICQICKSLKFEGAQESVCDALVDITRCYIHHLAEEASSFAEMANRTEVNFNDVALALQQVNVSLIDLMAFAANSPEISFPTAVPPFPCSTEPVDTSKTLFVEESGEKGRCEEAPEWFPALPPVRTYRFTPVFSKKLLSNLALQKVSTKRRRQVSEAVAQLDAEASGEANSGNTANYSLKTLKEGAQQPVTLASDFGEPSIRNPYLSLPKVMPTPPQSTPIDAPSKNYQEYMRDLTKDANNDADSNWRPIDSATDDAEQRRKKQKAQKILEECTQTQ